MWTVEQWFATQCMTYDDDSNPQPVIYVVVVLMTLHGYHAYQVLKLQVEL